MRIIGGEDSKSHLTHGPGDLTNDELESVGYTENLYWSLPDDTVGVASYNPKIFALSRENCKHEIEKTMFERDEIKVFTSRASYTLDPEKGVAVSSVKISIIQLTKNGKKGPVELTAILTHGSASVKCGAEKERFVSALTVVRGIEAKGTAKVQMCNDIISAGMSGCSFCFGYYL